MKVKRSFSDQVLLLALTKQRHVVIHDFHPACTKSTAGGVHTLTREHTRPVVTPWQASSLFNGAFSKCRRSHPRSPVPCGHRNTQNELHCRLPTNPSHNMMGSVCLHSCITAAPLIAFNIVISGYMHVIFIHSPLNYGIILGILSFLIKD